MGLAGDKNSNSNSNNNNNIDANDTGGKGVEKTVQVFQGTCGWSQQQLAVWDVAGRGRRPSAADMKHPLRLYASQWPAVEVNSSNYAIPTVSAVEGWFKQVKTGPFRMTFKAFTLFTHRQVDPKALPAGVRALLRGAQWEARRVEWSEMGSGTLDLVWDMFNEVLITAYRHSTGKLGAVVVFQFPLGFGPTAANLRHVLECRRRLDYRIGMAVEFRDRSWFVGEAKTQLNLIQKLKDRGVALVHADELLHETFPKEYKGDDKPVHKVLPVSMDVTSAEFAYVRIHRRAGFEDRRLSREEIDRWAIRIATIAGKLDDGGIIFVFWGTEHRNEPLNNGRNLAKALEAVPGVVVAEPSNSLRQAKALSIDQYFPFMGK